MSIPINIQGTIIAFPASGNDPNWAPAVIQFAQAVEAALQGVAGPFDVAPQAFAMTSNLNVSPVDLSNLTFPTSDVRAVFINFVVFRSTDTTSVYEAGDIIASYDASAPTNDKWDVIIRRNGDAKVDITISDTGQVQFTSLAIAGSNHVGRFTYKATALTQS